MDSLNTTIHAGAVIDGLRSGRYVADIGIKNGRIAAIGGPDAQAGQVLDACSPEVKRQVHGRHLTQVRIMPHTICKKQQLGQRP